MPMITESSQQEQLFASSTTQPSVLGELSYVSNDIFALKMFFTSLFCLIIFNVSFYRCAANTVFGSQQRHKGAGRRPCV